MSRKNNLESSKKQKYRPPGVIEEPENKSSKKKKYRPPGVIEEPENKSSK